MSTDPESLVQSNVHKSMRQNPDNVGETNNNNSYKNTWQQRLAAAKHTMRYSECFCICVTVIGFGVLIAFAIIVGNLLSETHHGPARFEVDSLMVSSMMISNTTSYDSVRDNHYYMTGDFNITLSMTTKETGVLYESLVVSTRYNGNFLSSTPLNPFYRKKGDQETVQVGIPASMVRISDVAAEGIARDLARPGALEFEVDVRGHYWSLLEGQFGYNCFMKATCKRIMVEFSSPHNSTIIGSMRGPPVPCKSRSPDC